MSKETTVINVNGKIFVEVNALQQRLHILVSTTGRGAFRPDEIPELVREAQHHLLTDNQYEHRTHRT